MKLLILSDTHHDRKDMEKIIPMIKKEIDLIIHAGDNFADSIYLKEKSEKPVIAVAGNCDFDNVETELDFEIEGVGFFLTHGHRYRVKYGLDILAERAREVNARVCIFGHTHVKEDSFIRGVHIINPGSFALPRDGVKRSYVVMNVENGNYDYEFRYL